MRAPFDGRSFRVPRYFFHICDGRSFPDREGSELVDIYAAQTEAVRLAGGVLREMGQSFWECPEWSLEVVGEHGRVLFALRLLIEETPVVPGTFRDHSGSI